MKPAVYLLWLLYIALFNGGGQAYAGSSSLSKQSLQTVKATAFTAAAKAEIKPGGPDRMPVPFESIVAVDDENDDEDQHLIGKQAPVVTSCALVFALWALPPPVSASSINTASSQHPSFLRSCRYIAQRALLI